MRTCYYPKGDAVQFANDLLRYLKPDLPSTMTIQRDMSGDFSVTFVTTGLSADTVETLLKPSTSTSPETTPAG